MWKTFVSGSLESRSSSEKINEESTSSRVLSSTPNDREVLSSTPNDKEVGDLCQDFDVSSIKVSSKPSLTELFRDNDVRRLTDGRFPEGKELLKIHKLVALPAEEREENSFLVSWFVTMYVGIR